MRTQERFSDKKLVGPYRGEVEQDLADAPRFIDGIAKLFAASDIKGYEAPLATLSAQLKASEDWTREQILPPARSDHRLPPALYADHPPQAVITAPAPDDLLRRATTDAPRSGDAVL